MSNSFPQPPNTSFLTDLIPVKRRKQVYAVYSLVGALLLLTCVATAAVTQDLPVSLVVSSLVYNGAGPFFGALAGANAKPTGEEAVNE